MIQPFDHALRVAESRHDKFTLPQQLARRDLSRHRAYQENLDFYEGSQWLGNARRRERRLTFNYSKTFI